MSIEEKLELLERMRNESRQNEYRMQCGGKRDREESLKTEDAGARYRYGMRLRLIVAMFLFLVFCGISSSKDTRYQNFSEEIMKYLQNDFNIGYNDITDFSKTLSELK